MKNSRKSIVLGSPKFGRSRSHPKENIEMWSKAFHQFSRHDSFHFWWWQGKRHETDRETSIFLPLNSNNSNKNGATDVFLFKCINPFLPVFSQRSLRLILNARFRECLDNRLERWFPYQSITAATGIERWDSEQISLNAKPSWYTRERRFIYHSRICCRRAFARSQNVCILFVIK